MKTSFPKDQIEIVLLEGTHPDGIAHLEQEGFTIDALGGALEGDALLDAIGRAHIVGVRSKTQLTSEVLRKCSRLLSIGCFCAGTNQVDLDCATSLGVPVFNSPFSNTRSVAELTIAEIIALHRKLTQRSHALHTGSWDKSATGSHEVRGKTLGIIGYGHIGSQVSVLAEAIGMRVVFFDTLSKLPLGNASCAESIDDLLSVCDVVTIHVPDNSSTRNLMSAAQISKMKPGAYLINNARGSVVDLDALRASVESGHLGGAAVDVFPDEPSRTGESFNSVLQGADNVILTPHVGGSTIEAQQAISMDVAGKLARFINAGTTTGAVNVPEVDLPEQSSVAQPEGHRPHRILNFHRNVPGVLGKIHEAAADLGVNITGEYLRTRDQLGYVVIDADPSDASALRDRLSSIEESIRTRMLW
jgi:D-3-phosphoglycerate dehydrogenase